MPAAMRRAAAYEHFGPQKLPKQPTMRFSHLPPTQTIREHQPMVLQLAAQDWPAVHFPGAAAFLAASADSDTNASDRQASTATNAIFMIVSFTRLLLGAAILCLRRNQAMKTA